MAEIRTELSVIQWLLVDMGEHDETAFSDLAITGQRWERLAQ